MLFSLLPLKITFEGIPLADRWEEFSGIRVQFSQMEQVGWLFLLCNRPSLIHSRINVLLLCEYVKPEKSLSWWWWIREGDVVGVSLLFHKHDI